MGDILKGYLHVKCSGQSRLTRKAWRKRWLVMEFPWRVEADGKFGREDLEDKEDRRDGFASILVRIYTSHVHENRGPPGMCVQVLEIHALHRIQSRSQPYAFSVDGSSGELVAAGGSETETQDWIRSIRTRIWKPNQPSDKPGFQVSLIDNIHSDVARLRGFYGKLEIDREEGDIVLLEERSGAEQVRWSLDSMNRVFCPKTISKKDRDKILVIITKRKSKSIGQGIFTFYSEDARIILSNIQDSIKQNSDKKKSGKSKLNPLSFLFKAGSGGGEPAPARDPARPPSRVKQERGRRKVLEKSRSMIDRFDPAAVQAGDSRDYACDMRRAATPSPPPYPSPPDDQPISNLLQEGHYYRFDKEQKYDPIKVEASGNAEEVEVEEDRMDDALVKLQNIERSLLELSQQTLQPQDIRCSYISVDSGRSSDTYAETSASSITSTSTNHSNRLNSNASNCSADSGTDLSAVGDKEASAAGGGGVTNPPAPAERGVPMSHLLRVSVQDNPYGCIKRLPARDAHNKEQIYGRSGQSKPQDGKNPIYERRNPSPSGKSHPPPLPARFATIRKSLTLPHNISNYQEGEEEEGTINTKKETQMYSSINRYDKKMYCGEISGNFLSLREENYENLPSFESRNRPATLHLETRRFQRAVSVDEPRQRKASTLKNRNLERMRDADLYPPDRLRAGDCDLYPPERSRAGDSAPSTPMDSNRLIEQIVLPTVIPEHRENMGQPGDTKTLKKNKSTNLFNSTPENLDSFNQDYSTLGWRHSNGKLSGWQSSDGLTTPVSISGRSPIHTPASLKGFSPMQTPSRTPSTLYSPVHTSSVYTRTARIRKSSFRGSDSMFNSRVNSPRRVTTPTMGSTTRRFHSIPRSSTTEGISESPTRPSGPPSNGSSTLKASTSHYSKPTTKHGTNSQSLDNLICKGNSDNVYMEMRRFDQEHLTGQPDRPSDYLEMARVHHKRKN